MNRHDSEHVCVRNRDDDCAACDRDYGAGPCAGTAGLQRKEFRFQGFEK